MASSITSSMAPNADFVAKFHLLLSSSFSKMTVSESSERSLSSSSLSFFTSWPEKVISSSPSCIKDRTVSGVFGVVGLDEKKRLLRGGVLSIFLASSV